MQVNVRRFAACALIALLVPAAAVAAGSSDVTGPVTLTGNGYFGGELTMQLGEEQRPLRVVGRIGYVGFLDLGGDLKVRCGGRARPTTQRTEQGRVYLCKGRFGQAVALGSHFAFRGFAARYQLQLPAGAAGTLNGPSGPAGERGERSGKPRGEGREERERNAPLPTIAQVAALLAAVAG
jgi:hypothetical protein